MEPIVQHSTTDRNELEIAKTFAFQQPLDPTLETRCDASAERMTASPPNHGLIRYWMDRAAYWRGRFQQAHQGNLQAASIMEAAFTRLAELDEGCSWLAGALREVESERDELGAMFDGVSDDAHALIARTEKAEQRVRSLLMLVRTWEQTGGDYQRDLIAVNGRVAELLMINGRDLNRACRAEDEVALLRTEVDELRRRNKYVESQIAELTEAANGLEKIKDTVITQRDEQAAHIAELQQSLNVASRGRQIAEYELEMSKRTIIALHKQLEAREASDANV